MTADLLGNGTACLVWSSPLPGDARRPLRYIDLMGGTKPHLLVKSVNNLGAETQVHYAPSTQVLPGGQARRQAVDHPAAVPGARRRARRDLRPHQRQPLRHPLRLPPRLLRRRSSASSAASAWWSSGTPRSSPRSTPAARLPAGDQHRRGLARAAGPHQDLVPHRRLPRPRSRLRLLRRPARRRRRGRVLPRAGPDRRAGATRSCSTTPCCPPA